MKNKTKTRVKSLILNSIIIFLLIIMLYPLAMSLWSSVKKEVSFQATKWYQTLPMYFSNIAYAFRKLTRYMLNTVLVAGCGTLGMLFISSLAAYAFSKLHFPGKNIFYMAVISLMMIPGILTLVPSFMLYKSLIGLDNYMILILPQIVGPVFGVFLLRSFFEGIPEDIFEASRIDGAGEFKIYMKVCLPLSLPIMGTLAIMQITNAWNDYMWPMITIHTFQYGDIYFNSGHDNNRWALKSGLGYKYTLFYEGTYFHENQIAVTYLHSEPWTGFKPDYEGDNLPNVINKLKKGENVKIVYYGDSITKGGNASGMFGVAPNMPIWAEMVTQRLKQAYPKANITMYNPAENATDSTQGLKDCKVKVANQKPDLVIMGYGMNDGTNSKLTPAAYQSNIKMIREMVRALYSKQTDFILIATTLPNPEIKLGDASYQAEYESVLYELEQKGTLGGEGGTIVANMTKTHQELLKKKRFFDMTANNVNHPNDFLVRAQAQNVLSLLIENYQ